MGVFNNALHPRGKGAQGGQFIAKGTSGNNDTVGYDANHGTGAGYGTKGGDARVKNLQSALNELGLKGPDGKPLVLDGKLGPKTTAAIKSLQRRLGLKPDGLVTPQLLTRIKSAAHRTHTTVAAHAAHAQHAKVAHAAHTAHVKTAAKKVAKKAMPARKAK